MRHLHWSLVLVGLLLAASPAPAQSFIMNNPYGYDYGGSGVWINYTHHHHHTTLSISAGRFAAPAFSIGPVFGPFCGPVLPSLVIPPLYGPVINQQVTVVNYRPPPMVLPGPFVLDDLTLAVLPRPEPELPLNPRPLPDRNKPKDREKKPAQPEPAPPPRPEAPKPPQPKPPDMPRIPHPDPEPRGEYARLIELGKESFADTDYGLAAQRFRQATNVLPNDGLARFLLAQALLALGKYQDAVDANNTGVSSEPNWPASNFHPLDLYGAHVALYPDHLHRLEDAVSRHPNDAVVLFLFGYELWFDGRKDEARGLFQKAAAAGADAVVIDRFFRALPPAGGV